MWVIAWPVRSRASQCTQLCPLSDNTCLHCHVRPFELKSRRISVDVIDRMRPDARSRRSSMNRGQFQIRRCRAYSLVELVLVLVTLAIMWGIAAPRYANSMSRYRAEAAARRIASDFALARAQAKQTSTNVVVVFD